ncbi:multidrug efflux RND transporter permease subunit [Burkholderia stabilis]|uniref:efflux RND transporter permease subunit n=1 Tax=Burkholderia stabilis TaxID=95485 RepID=UPI000851C602|nr:multidrug efflux RND transporter permease subunit [Burkholderia stabilis]AOR72863.1 multidrug efflux RND transporter permease subunit [Burkholderia stabilis]HDR9492264.1 multidrug efflux RND transporter permease subunit [Burkholderia stabilis]HDR9522806.1 multidrug efflux RND transporter permease subunit [Burkholderia stabilis]HDR9539876.1 multidrug efflux RND transporter permease subunit [Burkholderia stabilis]HDR9554514.1 multidrug efflux RND transporter permease subunit [Burkholderia sta
MDFSKFFIDRPIFAVVLSIIIFAIGLIAIPMLPTGEYPEVVPPSVVVRATYPGANPKEIAESVAEPLEEAINGVEGIMYMKSVAGSDGSLQVVVTFMPSVDADTAAVRVQNRVSQALSRLPDEVRQYGVTTQKQSPTPLMYIGLISPDGSRDPLYLRNYLTLHVKDELSRIPGIGDVSLHGSGDYAMRIWLDPNRLASRGLTAGDVIAAVREQNVQVSAGQLGAEPSPKATDFLMSINVRGRLRTTQEFGDIVLKNGADGQVVKLSDVARIELGAGDYTLRAHLDQSDAATVGIFLAPGANALAVAKAVYAKLDELAKRFPPGLTYKPMWDPTVFVRESIRAVQHTLIEAVVLVVLVVILFLQTWRASIIPLVAVPVSVVGTFAWLLLLGYSINTLTLFGLVLAIGIVVDDAIVVVENVERNIEQGLSPRDAAHQAMKEVSGPIIAIALVLCAVFVPMAFLSGVTGQFYKQFAVTIAISTVISAINSLTLSPALAAKLLRPHDAPPDALSRVLERLFGRLFRGFNRFFLRSSDRYHGVVGRTFQQRGAVFVVYVGLLAATALLFKTVPGGFIPIQDKLYLFAGAKLPEGASLSRTDAVVRQMVKIAHETEGVEMMPAFAGMNALQVVNTPNITSSYILLKPFDQRKRSAAQINADLNARFAGIKGGFAYALMPPPIQGLGNGSGYALYLEDRAGLGYGVLQNAVNAFQVAVAKTPGMHYPVSTYQSNIPQLEVKVDRLKAKAQGVALTDLFEALQVYLGSVYVNDFNVFGRVYRVMAQADAAHRQSVEDIANLRVRNANGEMVPIGSMVTVTPTFGPDPVVRYNGYPAAGLIGEADPAVLSSAQAIAKLQQIAKDVLPPGITLEWTDLSYQQVTQSNAAIVVFPLAVMLVFLVLAALYESWTLPLAVILIVPVCMAAALFGVWLSGGDNNVFVQVGLVVLMGLACKNAILIVEFARELEIHGKGIVEAALEACRLRLRPIVMTSVAFIAGSVPLMIGSGAGSEVRAATGVTVFAGMLGVTLFGLFLTPVFYVVIRTLAGGRQSTAWVEQPVTLEGELQ